MNPAHLNFSDLPSLQSDFARYINNTKEVERS